MKSSPDSSAAHAREEFLLHPAGVLTLAFAAVVCRLRAVFWGSVLALMFQPLYRKVRSRMRGRQTLAALATLAIILLIVILPMAVVAVSLVQEVGGLYARVKSGEVNFGRYFEQIVAAMPGWMSGLMDRFGLIDLPALQASSLPA